jgi:hypothetical protein
VQLTLLSQSRQAEFSSEPFDNGDLGRFRVRVGVAGAGGWAGRLLRMEVACTKLVG